MTASPETSSLARTIAGSDRFAAYAPLGAIPVVANYLRIDASLIDPDPEGAGIIESFLRVLTPDIVARAQPGERDVMAAAALWSGELESGLLAPNGRSEGAAEEQTLLRDLANLAKQTFPKPLRGSFKVVPAMSGAPALIVYGAASNVLPDLFSAGRRVDLHGSALDAISGPALAVLGLGSRTRTPGYRSIFEAIELGRHAVAEAIAQHNPSIVASGESWDVAIPALLAARMAGLPYATISGISPTARMWERSLGGLTELLRQSADVRLDRAGASTVDPVSLARQARAQKGDPLASNSWDAVFDRPRWRELRRPSAIWQFVGTATVQKTNQSELILLCPVHQLAM
jgi:hypothetical protein